MNSSASPHSERRIDPWLAAIVLIAAAGGALLVARARNWAVMTDELLYTDMARSIAHSIFPLAQVRGDSVPVNQVLFPTLIAPIVGTLSMPSAYPVIAAVNAIVFATAAIPTYLLTNLITGNRTAARWVAACTVVTPWLAFSSKVVPDPLAYVAVLWAAYAMVRTVGRHERPLKGDLLTLLAIALAYLVRNQFLLLVGVWIAAVVLCRVAETLGERNWRELPRELIELLKQRPLPIVVFVLVVLIVELHPSWLLGLYSITTTGARGGAAPSGIVNAFLTHASVIGVDLAGLPFVLGLPWLVVALARVKDRVQNDAAIVIVLLTCAVLFVGASFDLRFTEFDRVIERYIFYCAPLLLVAMAAFLTKPPKQFAAFALPAIAGLLLLNARPPYGLDAEATLQINHAFSPLEIGLVAYQKVADALGTSIFGVMIVVLILVSGAVWWLIKSERSSLALNGAFTLLLAVLLATTIYTVPKVVDTQNRVVDNIQGQRNNRQKAWVDTATAGKPASLAFSLRTDVTNRAQDKRAERITNWWDLAIWNGSISATYLPLRGNPHPPSPFPGRSYTMLPDWQTGALARTAGDPARYLVQAVGDPNFGPQYSEIMDAQAGYVIYDTGGRATAAWATKGLTMHGWVPPAGATLRIWAPRTAKQSAKLVVNLMMATTRRSRVLKGFTVAQVLRGSTLERAKMLKQARVGRRTLYAWPVTVPAGGHADFKLVRGAGNAHVEQIRVSELRDSAGTSR